MTAGIVSLGTYGGRYRKKEKEGKPH